MAIKTTKNYIIERISHLKNIAPKKRKFILIISDLLIISISLFLTYYLSGFEELLFYNYGFINLSILTITLGIPLYIFTAQYNSLSSYFRSQLIYKFLMRNFFLVCLVNLMGRSFLLSLPGIRFWIIFWLVNTALIVGNRLLIKDIISFINYKNHEKHPKVVIYGAGSAGAQLASSINLSRSYEIEAFIDDNPSLWGRSLDSKKIIPPNKLGEIISRIEYVLIAIPSLGRNRKKKLIKTLSIYKVPILEIPSIEELTLGNAQISSLRPICLEDLIGRVTAPTKSNLLGNKINNSIVFVTGAGGSIGSELCRQILNLNPKKLILFECNEFALYTLDGELKEIGNKNVEIIPILGNATDYNLLSEIFENNKINIVFHAAAYKHVPLVEINPLQGLYNNIYSSYLICKICEEKTPNDIVLISSDKAVRPSNIMGASKRLAELIFKSFALKSNKHFSMVRFGNVIGSSGSVVPLFKKQIENGGPIKVTHNEVIRYFMTINEACGLVLQAIELSKGGDIFLLEMGQPIKIIDLAKQMIFLSGLKVKDANNPNGDIEIITTGLRPGEKLFEELLVDGKAESTINPLIYRANENLEISKDFLKKVDLLISLLKKRNKNESLSLLSSLIPEWHNVSY